MPSTLLSVLVPLYNEEEFVAPLIERVLQAPLPDGMEREIIVVDDGSRDGSAEIVAELAARHPEVRLVRHERNRGKGAAIRTGLEALSAPIVIIQDADMEYDPLEFNALIEPVLQGRADVVYGVRGFAAHTAYSYWFVQGNRFVTTFTNVLFNCYIQDMETGYKLMRTSLMRRLHLRGDRFNIEPDITGRVLRLGYRIHEVPIHYYARGRDEGKKLTWRDGVRAVFALLAVRLSSRRRLFGADDAYHEQRLTALAAAPRLPELPPTHNAR